MVLVLVLTFLYNFVSDFCGPDIDLAGASNRFAVQKMTTGKFCHFPGDEARNL